MIERFNAYFKTLEGLSTEELDRSAEKLVRAEKRNLALLIAHIAEMSRRKGQLERGYSNLFDYCTRRLHLSEGSVALRIQVANVSRRICRRLSTGFVWRASTPVFRISSRTGSSIAHIRTRLQQVFSPFGTLPSLTANGQ